MGTNEGSRCLLVILGAGATHDVIPGANPLEAPPLTKDLFADRFYGFLNKFPGSSAAANRVMRGMRKNGDSLEEELQKLRDQAVAGYSPLTTQLLALQFYLQDIMAKVSQDWGSLAGGMNNLATLVAGLEEWRHEASAKVLYVTFNYDTLLEQALDRELGHTFESVGKYLMGERAVVKVHGSWNWKREIEGPRNPSIGGDSFDALIRLAPSLRYSDRYHVIAGTSQVALTDTMLAPAIALPIVNKTAPAEFSAPPEHLALMREWLPDVSEVLVIGWRGMEAHFLKELKSRAPQNLSLTIVGRPVQDSMGNILSPEAAGVLWPRALGWEGRSRVYPTGFSGFIETRLSEYLVLIRS